MDYDNNNHKLSKAMQIAVNNGRTHNKDEHVTKAKRSNSNQHCNCVSVTA